MIQDILFATMWEFNCNIGEAQHIVTQFLISCDEFVSAPVHTPITQEVHIRELPYAEWAEKQIHLPRDPPPKRINLDWNSEFEFVIVRHTP
jgi:hypothetical protein